jgi:hypothetical protein
MKASVFKVPYEESSMHDTASEPIKEAFFKSSVTYVTVAYLNPFSSVAY